MEDFEKNNPKPFEERIVKLGYSDLIAEINKVEEGASISVIVQPELGEQDAFFFGVAILPEEPNKKKFANIAAVRKGRFARLYEVQLWGDSNGAVVFRKIKSIMKSMGVQIGRYNTQYAVDKETYNKLNGIMGE